MIYKQDFYTMYNIGESIKAKMAERRMTPTQVTRAINMSRAAMTNIVTRTSINTDLLKLLCEALDYNFFEDLANQPMNITRKPNKDSLVNFVNDAELEIKYKKLLEEHLETIKELMKLKLELAKATQK